MAKKVRIPVIGIGGICSATDALEFLMAGASAVEIGSANFVDPSVTQKVVDGLEAYCRQEGISDIKEIIGII